MKPAFLRTTFAAAVTLTALTGTVGAQSVCMDTVEMEAALKDWYGEAPVQDFAGEKRQVWASDVSGTWTVVSYLSDGNACVVDQGNNWPDVADANPLLASLEQ